MNHKIFITGGSGYIGSALIPQLIKRGHEIRALVRSQSLYKIPTGWGIVSGDVLDNKTYEDKIFPSDTFVHLVGVSHPNPFKKELFVKVDLKSLEQTLDAAISSNIKHFVYLSVAHPAPIMKSYIEVRKKCETLIYQSGLSATIIRPWYVLGPGHYWAYLLIPFYKIFQNIPITRDTARRLGLVTLFELIKPIIYAIDNPPAISVRVIEVPQILNGYFKL